MTESFFREEQKILQMAFHVEKVKRALWRQHFVDQEQHVTFWWDCGKKQFSTISILYNYMLMNQLVNLTQHFVDFDGGQDQQH